MTEVTTPPKVARNLTRSFFEIGHKRCNSSDHISMSEICARELRATLLGNQPDWKPTHETAAWVHWYNTRRPHLALGGITPQQAENQHTTTRNTDRARGRPHPGDPPRDHTNRRYKLTNPHPHHGTPASTDQRYQHHHPSHQQWTHPGHPHAPPHSYAAAPHPSSYHGPSTQTQPRQQHHAQNQ